MDQIDLRFFIAALAILFAGATKGISGFGLPVIAIPIMAILYDLPTAIGITILPTVLSDLPLVYKFRQEWRITHRFVIFILLAVAGVVVGTQILVTVDQRPLKLLLGLGVLFFAITSWFRLLPALGDRLARRWAPPAGLLAGTLQGATGSAAPIVTIFFFQLQMSRQAFLFLINSYFLVVDSSQLVSLIWVGVYTPRFFLLALGATLLALPAVFLTLRLQDRISDQFFRKAVLVLLGITGVVLVLRAYG